QTTHDIEQTTSPIQSDPTETTNDTIHSSTPIPTDPTNSPTFPNTPFTPNTEQTTHDTEQTTSPIQTDPTEKPNDTIYSSTPTPNPSPSHTTINPTPTPPIPDQPPQPTRTSTRTKQVPNKLSDYQCSIPKSLIHHIQKHSFHKYINYDNIKSKSTRNFIHTLNTSTEPHTYAQASKDLKWVEATNKELKALEANKTWELVLLPPNKLPIGCK
ncbi:retrovirus-related pol polyprotein from transposon TNT 1-94, partial [Tanacetum coccineum]